MIFRNMTLIALVLCGAFVAVAGESEDTLLKAFGKTFPAGAKAKMIPAESGAPRIAEIRRADALLGYIVDLNVVSRSGSFRLLVAVSPEMTVVQVLTPDYPHRRGRAVRNPQFLDQFKGAAYGEPLRLGREVDGVSGATSSADAVTGGVRQALVAVNRHSKGSKQHRRTGC